MDADGQLKERKDLGVAMVRIEYDEAGNVIEEAYYGADGELKETKDYGAAIIRWEYDEHGKIVKTLFFDRYRRSIR